MNPCRALLPVLLVAGCASFRAPSRADLFSREEKLEYLVLAVLSEDAGREYLRLPDSRSRYEYSDFFWSRPEFAPAGDSLREFYLNRAARAHALFGTIDLLNDDRVRAFIRHGPARRESFSARPGAGEWLRSPETPVVTIRPAEIWTWDSLGLQQDFIRTGTAFRLVGETRFGPKTFWPMLEPTDGFPPLPAVPLPPVRLECELTVARFRSESDTVETEIHFGLPTADLKRLTAMDPHLTIRLDFEWRGRKRGRNVSRRIFVTPVLTGPDMELTVGRQVFRLPVDDFELTLTATLPTGSTRQIARRVNLIAYARHIQPTSDMAFYTTADSTFQSPQFEGHGLRRLVPTVRPELHPGGTVHILFTLYNLATDPEGHQRVHVNYDIYETQSRREIVILTPGKYLVNEGPTAVLVERLHLMDLAPGEYTVVARCRDEIAARDITVTGDFRIRPR